MQNVVQFVQISVDDLTNLIQKTVADEVTKVIGMLPVQKQSDDPELLTRKEAMELLGKSYPYLWRLNKKGILRSRKMGRGRSVYYYKQDIFDLLNNTAA